MEEKEGIKKRENSYMRISKRKTIHQDIKFFAGIAIQQRNCMANVHINGTKIVSEWYPSPFELKFYLWYKTKNQN